MWHSFRLKLLGKLTKNWGRDFQGKVEAEFDGRIGLYNHNFNSLDYLKPTPTAQLRAQFFCRVKHIQAMVNDFYEHKPFLEKLSCYQVFVRLTFVAPDVFCICNMDSLVSIPEQR